MAKQLSIQGEARAGGDRPLQQNCCGIGSEAIAFDDAGLMTMRIGLAQERGADIVRSIDQFDLLAPPQTFTDAVEVVGEACGVTPADIG